VGGYSSYSFSTSALDGGEAYTNTDRKQYYRNAHPAQDVRTTNMLFLMAGVRRNTYIRKTAKYTWRDHKTNEDTLKELKSNFNFLRKLQAIEVTRYNK
jgi:hypothetical protein